MDYLYTKIFQKVWMKVFGKKIDMKELDKEHRLIDAVPKAYGIDKPPFWDTLIDSINRLPRPILTFWAIYLLFLPLFDIDNFREIILRYGEMPTGIAVIITTIISFWFGTKLATKTLVDPKKMLQQLQDLKKLKEEVNYTNDIKDTSKPLSNEAIAEWNKNKTK